MERVPQRVLIVEADGATREAMVQPLQRGGFHAVGVATAAEAVTVAGSQRLAAIIAGPGVPGADILRGVRAVTRDMDVPIVVISGQADEIDRVVAFELGADEYLVAPISPRELVLRVRALTRRATVGGPGAAPVRFGACELDPQQMRVFAGGHEVRLSATEFWLLEAIVRRGGAVVPRGMLLREFWADEAPGNTRSLDTLVRRVRVKLGVWGASIETVRSVGYRLALDPPRAAPARDPRTDRSPR